MGNGHKKEKNIFAIKKLQQLNNLYTNHKSGILQDLALLIKSSH